MIASARLFSTRVAALCLLLGACSPPPPKQADEVPPPPDDIFEEDDQPDSSEWLYATARFRGDEMQECTHVYGWVKGERSCSGPVCKHAARLGRDWLLRCRGRLAGNVAEVEELVVGYAARATQSDTACTEEAESLLRRGCPRGGEKCESEAQGWATRCAAEVSSPLTIRMLEAMIEPALQPRRRVELDARGCPELERAIVKASDCGQRFECEDRMEVVETYRARCEQAGKRPSAETAAAQLQLTLGAERELEPVPLDPARASFDKQSSPLVLDDGSGRVLSVCGKRPETLAQYVSARESCSGEVVIARVFGGAQKTLRPGRLPHASSTRFALLFPSLTVPGEVMARDEAGSKELRDGLDGAARRFAETQRGGFAALVEVLAKHRDEVRNSQAAAEVLSQRDSMLVPVFRALGAAKAKAATWKMKRATFVRFTRRARRFPLADVDTKGAISVGALSGAAALELDAVLPKAMDAYRDALAQRFERLDKLRIDPAWLAEDAMEAGKAGAACGEATKSLRDAEKRALACAFGSDGCDADPDAIAKAHERASKAAARAWVSARVAIAILGDDKRAEAEGLVKQLGCEAPRR